MIERLRAMRGIGEGNGQVRFGSVPLSIEVRSYGTEIWVPTDISARDALRLNAKCSPAGPHYVWRHGGVVLRAVLTDLTPDRELERIVHQLVSLNPDGPNDKVDEVALFDIVPARLPSPEAEGVAAALVLARDGVCPGRHHRLSDGFFSLTLAQPAGGDGTQLYAAARKEAVLLATILESPVVLAAVARRLGI